MSKNIKEITLEIDELKKELNDKRAALRKAKEVEILSLQSDIAEAIKSTIFGATKSERVDKKFERYALIKSLLSDENFVEFFRKIVSQFLPENDDKAYAENVEDFEQNFGFSTPNFEYENSQEFGENHVEF